MFDALKFEPLHLYYLLKYLLFSVLMQHPEGAAYIHDKCSENILFWLEFFVSVPGAANKMPYAFKNYRYKKDYIKKLADNLKNGRGLVVSKSENMPATELTALVLLWYWMFRRDSSFFIFSRTTRKLFKTSDAESIFGLYAFILEKTPTRLLIPYARQHELATNKGYRLTIRRQKQFRAVLVNVRNKNVIYGFSGGRQNFWPAGKRLRAVWFDDMAFQRYERHTFDKVQKLLPGVPVVATSCAGGKTGAFFELTQSNSLDQYTLHWADNPECDENWFNELTISLDPVYMEQYYNINFDYQYKKPVVRAQKTSENEKPARKKRRQRSSYLKVFGTTSVKVERKSYSRAIEAPQVRSFAEFVSSDRAEQINNAGVSSFTIALACINWANIDIKFYNIHNFGVA